MSENKINYGIETDSGVRKLTKNGNVMFEVKDVFGDHIEADESTIDKLSLEDRSVMDEMAETTVNNFDRNKSNIVDVNEERLGVTFEVDLPEFDFNLIVGVAQKENISIV